MIITKIFSQPIPFFFSAYVVWHRNHLSSSSHPLDLGQHYPLQALDVGLCNASEVMWDDEEGITTPMFETTLSTMLWTECLVFIKRNIKLSSE